MDVLQIHTLRILHNVKKIEDETTFVYLPHKQTSDMLKHKHKVVIKIM